VSQRKAGISRRGFLQTSAATTAAWTIVPRHVLGGPGEVPPSEIITAGLVGCGGQGGEDLRSYIAGAGGEFRLVARCDVKFADTADNRNTYTDFRRVVERKDIDVISVATPPGWRPLDQPEAVERGLS